MAVKKVKKERQSSRPMLAAVSLEPPAGPPSLLCLWQHSKEGQPLDRVSQGCSELRPKGCKQMSWLKIPQQNRHWVSQRGGGRGGERGGKGRERETVGESGGETKRKGERWGRERLTERETGRKKDNRKKEKREEKEKDEGGKELYRPSGKKSTAVICSEG